MSTEDRRRLKERLKQNVGFIRRSCELYDQGHKEEAIRIATALRVLLHDTRRSVSLLKHLKVKGITKLNSSCNPPKDVIAYHGMGRVTMNVVKEEGTYKASRRIEPVLDEDAARNFAVPVQDWWEMPVYVSRNDAGIRMGGAPDRNIFIRRKDLILGAANQDGGAHVDADLDPDYEFLASIGALHMYEGEVGFVDGTVAHLPPLEDAHLVYLRQMGYEVLGSLDLKILLAIP